MKKHYEKPFVAIEHYELTQTIASCGTKINFNTSQCVMQDPDPSPEMKSLAAQGYFAAGICQFNFKDLGEENGICYHTNVNAAFTS